MRWLSCRTWKGRTIAALIVGVGLWSFISAEAITPDVQTLRVGPVYTSADGRKAPEFPVVQVVLGQPVSGGIQAPKEGTQAGPLPSELSLVEDGVEGGHATEVTPFDATGYGLAAVVAIDVSGSMAGSPINAVRSSLYKFVSDARKQDSAGVVTIADDAAWDVPFGTDPETMKTALRNLHTRGKLTKLYDGMLTAMSGFNSSLPTRRELSVISDGHDEGSQSTLEQVVQMAHDRGIAIDTIGLTRSNPKYLETLRTLAAETGGSFQQVHNDQELQALISSGMDRLRATPVARFEARRIAGDGKVHTLGVRWKGATDLAGDTAFIAPRLNLKQKIRMWVRHIPAWGYGVLAAACAGLLIAVILMIRGLRRRDAAADVPYGLPRKPDLPGAPAAGGFEGVLHQNGFADEPLSAAGFERQSETVGLRVPSVAPPVPRVRPAMQPVLPQGPGLKKRTRIAGVFDGAGDAIARLDILSGTLSGRSVEVPRGEFWIGAVPGNEFVISNDATVSSRHAYLVFEDPILILVDNRSTNGTRVNGKMLRGTRQPLQDGDQIQIGQTLLRLSSLA